MQTTSDNPNTPRLWDKRIFDTNTELLRSPFYIDKINKITSFLKNRNGSLLDMGFGAGNLERKILSKETNLQIYGIDFSDKAVKKARKELKGTYSVSRIQKVPFRDSFFDYVVILDVLEHLTEQEVAKTLAEVSRITKNRKYLIISVPLNEDLKKMNRENVNFNKHLRVYTQKKLARELRRVGFNIIKSDYIFAFSNQYFWKSLIMKILPKLKKPNLLLAYAQKQ